MLGTITGLYIACLAIGFIYTLIGAIFGELGAHGDTVSLGDHNVELTDHDASSIELGDHSVEIGEHGADIAGHSGELSYADVNGLHVSPLNSITIATFVGSFGAMGLIALWGLNLAPWPSLAFAIPTALVAATIQFVLYVRVLVGSSASSEATFADLTKCAAQVITSIPENGVGEIAYVIRGIRYTAPARAADGLDIPRGSRVRILRQAAGVMQVREF